MDHVFIRSSNDALFMKRFMEIVFAYRLRKTNTQSFTEDFELEEVLSMNYSFIIYKNNTQLISHISLRIHIHIHQEILSSYYNFNHLVVISGHIDHSKLYVNMISFSFSFCCFTVLVLCRLATRACR
jgi:hypothetical protein